MQSDVSIAQIIRFINALTYCSLKYPVAVACILDNYFLIQKSGTQTFFDVLSEVLRQFIGNVQPESY